MQLSIQGTHIHLLVEAENREALSKGMKAFKISAAKHINAAVSRAGSWWERRRMAVARSGARAACSPTAITCASSQARCRRGASSRTC